MWEKVNEIFRAFESSPIGNFIINKILFRSKSFYSILSFYGSILVVQALAYTQTLKWGLKVEEQLEIAQGWEYVGWFILSWLVPEGNILPIVIISLTILLAVMKEFQTNYMAIVSVGFLAFIGGLIYINHIQLNQLNNHANQITRHADIRFDELEKLIRSRGMSLEEFAKRFFGEDWEKAIQNEQTYNLLKQKLLDKDKTLEELIKEKEELLSKIKSHYLHPELQQKIESAISELRYKDAHKLFNDAKENMQKTVQDYYTLHYQQALLYVDELKYYDAKESIENIPTKQLEDTTWLSDYAKIYRLCGEYNLALPLYQKALAISEKVLGLEHPDTAATYNNIGGLYRIMGEYETALGYYQKALAISEKVLGLEHPDTAVTYNNLAVLYYKMSDYHNASIFMKKAVEILEKVLPATHPHLHSAKQSLEVIQSRINQL